MTKTSLPSTMRFVSTGLFLLVVGYSPAHAQPATTAPDSIKAAAECKGNFLSKAMCKGATKITQAALGTGLIAPPKMGTIAPPALPIFGTYRIRLVQEEADSLTFFVRTILPLDTRVQDGEWIGYGARFVSAMVETELPASLEAPEARSQVKVGGGPMILLTSSRDSSRFAITLPLSLPMMHPTVLGAKGTWLEDALKSSPPLKGISPKEYPGAANGRMGAAGEPSTFMITWKKKGRRFAMRAERISEVSFSAPSSK